MGEILTKSTSGNRPRRIVACQLPWIATRLLRGRKRSVKRLCLTWRHRTRFIGLGRIWRRGIALRRIDLERSAVDCQSRAIDSR